MVLAMHASVYSAECKKLLAPYVAQSYSCVMYKRCGGNVFVQVRDSRNAYRVLYTGMLAYNEVMLITIGAI
jgi:hypothetical protein